VRYSFLGFGFNYACLLSSEILRISDERFD